MPTFKRYPRGKTRTLIDFAAVVAKLEADEGIVMCIPSGLVDIIRKLLRDRGLWLTTYAVSNDDIGYEIPTEAEFTPVRQAILTFLEETSSMNCNDFLSALRDISSAVRAASCCSPGNGTSYVDDGEGGVFYGTEEPVDKPDTFGEGEEFATETAFQEHLCAGANAVVNGIILSLRSWSVLNLAQLTLGGLVIGIFVATPPLGLFIGLAVAAFSFAVLTSLAEYVEDHRDDWVCAIYQAGSYSEVLEAIDTQASAAISAEGLSSFSSLLLELFKAMVSTDTVNQLYRSVGLPELGEAVDCSECVTGDCETDALSIMVESSGEGEIVSIDVISVDVIDVHLTSEYFSGEDHEKAGVVLKAAYFDGVCGVYTNGFTYDSGPGSEANIDLVWVSPAGNDFSDGNPDGVHYVRKAIFVQSGSISPGTFTATVRLQRDAPA